MRLHLEKGIFCVSCFDITQFYRGELLLFVDKLLTVDFTSDLQIFHKLFDFFCFVIEVALYLLKESSGLYLDYYKGLEDPDLYITNEKVAVVHA